jgi:hypothetical protein
MKQEILRCCLIGVLVLAGTPAHAFGPLVLYDNFTTGGIDPNKWHGSELSFGAGAPNTEASRTIVNRQLRLRLTSYGRTDSNSGTPGVAGLRLRVTNPSVITAMQAKVTITQVEAEGCAANPSPTRLQANVVGHFFNDGSSTGPGDATGNILADLRKVRSTNAGDRIEASVTRCTTATCAPFQNVLFQVFSTPWVVGRADTLSLQWDEANDQFVFVVNPDTPTEEMIVLSYRGLLTDTTPPVIDLKQVSVGNAVANCMAGRKKGAITATFDNVRVNPNGIQLSSNTRLINKMRTARDD